MKENKVGFFAGCAGGFGFYTAWEFVALLWRTTTPQEGIIETVVGFVVGLVIGGLLYLGVHSLLSKQREVTKTEHETRYTILGIVAGLVIGFLFGFVLDALGVITLPAGGRTSGWW